MKDSQRRSTREDGRKQLLLVMKPELIREIKTAALQADKHTYELIEEVLTEYLERERSAGTL